MFSTLRTHLIVLDVPCSHSLQQHPRCHPNDPLSLIAPKIRCRTTESLSSLDSPSKLPTLSENLLLCPSALLLALLRHLGHILDFVLKHIYAFVRISNTFSIIDKLYFQFCVDTHNICLDGICELINFCRFVIKEIFLPYN